MGDIIVKLDSAKLFGKSLKKGVEVLCNDPLTPSLKVWLTGAVHKIVDTEPLVLRMGGLAGREIDGSFILKKGSWLDIEILEAKIKNRRAQVIGLEEVEKGGRYRLTLKSPTSARPSIFKDLLELAVRTSDGEDRRLTIPVTIDHKDRIITNPKRHVKFLAKETARLLDKNAKPLVASVLVLGGADEVNFQVKEIRLDDSIKDIFKTELITLREGKQYKISVTLEEYQAKRQALGKMVIVTDDPIRPERVLWVLAQFAGRRAPGNAGSR